MRGALIAVIRPANSCNYLDAFHTCDIQPEQKYQTHNRSDESRIGVLGTGASQHLELISLIHKLEAHTASIVS